MKFKIESSNITLTILNDATNQKITRVFKKDTKVGDIFALLYREKFINPTPYYFRWFCYYNNNIYNLRNNPKFYRYAVWLYICLFQH